MIKINTLSIFLFLIMFFYSCKSQQLDTKACIQKFKLSRTLAYDNPLNPSTLDSSLKLINECLSCDSIIVAVVDLKILIMLQMRKYQEALKFADSIPEDVFGFGYKKNYMVKGIKALDYLAKKDTINQILEYKSVSIDLEEYIQKHSLSDREFRSIYTDLFDVQSNYMDQTQINKEVESLEEKYPDKKSFFEFFRK